MNIVPHQNERATEGQPEGYTGITYYSGGIKTAAKSPPLPPPSPPIAPMRTMDCAPSGGYLLGGLSLG